METSLIVTRHPSVRRHSGFTLLELLVVIAVIAVFLGFVGISLTGDGAAGMGAAQRTVGTLLHQTRIQAIMNGSEARLLIYAEPDNSERYHRFLRVVVFKDEPYQDDNLNGQFDESEEYRDVDGSGGHNQTWVNVDDGVFLPDDVYIVPQQSDFSGLAVGSVSDWNPKVHSEWVGLDNFKLGDQSHTYAYVSFTARGTTGSGKIAFAVASPEPNESGGMSYRFTNPDDVVGLRMRPYGSFVLLSSIHDF
jgi:prepilin-type N-terminal cleavage/methylation domain-containing protein